MNLNQVMNGSIRRLAHIRRFSSLQVNRPENVMEHSWAVAFCAHQIALDINNHKPLVDEYVVLQKALYHDISETKSGDIIHSFKYGSSEVEKAMHNADQNNTRQLSKEFGMNGEYIYWLWDRAKDKSIEGQIVKFADFVSVVSYCREEWLAGNRHLEAENVLEHAFNKMKEYWGNHEYLGKYIDQLFPTGKYTDAYGDNYYHDQPTQLFSPDDILKMP